MALGTEADQVELGTDAVEVWQPQTPLVARVFIELFDGVSRSPAVAPLGGEYRVSC